MNNADQYKPTRPMKGVWLFFISKQRYVNAAIEHSAWLEMQAEDLRRKFLEGRYSPDLESTKTVELKRFESLRGQFGRSFGQVTIAAILALLISIGLKSVDTDFPFHSGKVIASVGTFLVAWAALFELGGPSLASWDGETLSETVHPRIFQILFIPGTFALLCSILL